MPAIHFYDHYAKVTAANGINLKTGTIKAVFLNANYLPNKSHTLYSHLNGEIANGNGYTTGGIVVNGKAITTVDTSGAEFDCADITVAKASPGFSGLRYIVLVDDTSKNLIGYIDLVTEYSNASADLSFTITGLFSATAKNDVDGGTYFFTQGLRKILNTGLTTAATIKVLLLKSSYVMNKSHATLTDIALATNEVTGGGYTAYGATLTLTPGEPQGAEDILTLIAASSTTWSYSATGFTAAAALVYLDGVDDANRFPVIYAAPTGSITNTTGDVTVSWPKGLFSSFIDRTTTVDTGGGDSLPGVDYMQTFESAAPQIPTTVDEGMAMIKPLLKGAQKTTNVLYTEIAKDSQRNTVLRCKYKANTKGTGVSVQIFDRLSSYNLGGEKELYFGYDVRHNSVSYNVKLAEAITATSTTIKLSGGYTNLPSSTILAGGYNRGWAGEVIINGEVIRYVTRTDNVLNIGTATNRGGRGTTAKNHAANSNVNLCFDFVMGGKLPGFIMGRSGGNYQGWPTNGDYFICRMMFVGSGLDISGIPSTYLYTMNYLNQRTRSDGTVYGNGIAFDWGINFKAPGYAGGIPVLGHDRWDRIEMYLKINDVGRENGIFRGWFNGKFVYEQKDLQLIDDAAKAKIEEINFGHHFGGSQDKWQTQKAESRDVDNYSISRTPIWGAYAE